MVPPTLVLGNRNYSSWSLRAWLCLELSGATYRVEVLDLADPATPERLLRLSPSGQVPVLRQGELVVWDSLAIAEYLAESYPAAGLWPAATGARALARALCAEMHSGFADLRREMPMNVRRRSSSPVRTAGLGQDIERIVAIWAAHGQEGPFLFGGPTIADAMFAPVVSRFRTYGVELEGAAARYADTVWAWSPMRAWVAAAEQEPWNNALYDL